MEVQVTITEICPVENIVSKKTGNEYHKYRFVGKTQGEYPKEICFETLGDDKFSQFNIVVGQQYNVSFDLESRRWNGKFFTSINAWMVTPISGQGYQQPVQQGYQPSNTQTAYGSQPPYSPMQAPAPMPIGQPPVDDNLLY